jgi:hypothetical protein
VIGSANFFANGSQTQSNTYLVNGADITGSSSQVPGDDGCPWSPISCKV